MASRNGKKSKGLRMLWIPGGRKSHPKGHFDSTNKSISYTTRQKKSEVWSLGGSKTQKDLLQAEPDTSLLDGPSTSGLSTLASSTASGAAAAAVEAATSAQCLADSHHLTCNTLESSIINIEEQEKQTNSPTTPNSTASTVPLVSPPQSPLDQYDQSSNKSKPSNFTTNITDTTTATTTTATDMPAKSHQPIPLIVTTTTTAEIMEGNRFSLLNGNRDIVTNDLDVYTLPSPPKNHIHSQENLNSSSGTTNSQITPTGSPHKSNNSQNGSVNNTPAKKKHRNHNNNQGDVNSIESVTEDNVSEKIPSGDLDWVDTIVKKGEDNELLNTPKKKKKKKHAKELDQLDGVPIKDNSPEPSVKKEEEEDEKVVKCLYYTLMCCDCSIS